ncbi:hypothetical protein HN51_044639 [Arachis hypogaea]
MSRRGTVEEKTAKSDPIYRNRLVNMLVNSRYSSKSKTGSPLRSNNSIELSMIVCVIASTIPGISMNPIIEILRTII